MAIPVKRLLWYWLPLVLYLGLIFFLSSLSHIPFNIDIGHIDKLIHFCEYAVLAMILARALGSLSWPGRWWGVALLTVIAVAICGLLDEAYQSLVPNRCSDIMDSTADALGGIMGTGAYLLFRRLFGRARSPGKDQGTASSPK